MHGSHNQQLISDDIVAAVEHRPLEVNRQFLLAAASQPTSSTNVAATDTVQYNQRTASAQHGST
jgi:hypothetical protein